MTPLTRSQITERSALAMDRLSDFTHGDVRDTIRDLANTALGLYDANERLRSIASRLEAALTYLAAVTLTRPVTSTPPRPARPAPAGGER